MPWCVYLLYAHGVTIPSVGKPGCRDTYVGMTNDLAGRIGEHNAGKVMATRGRRWQLRGYLPVRTRRDAAICERWFKTGDTRCKRLQLSDLGRYPDEKPEEAEALTDAAFRWHNCRQARRVKGELKLP